MQNLTSKDYADKTRAKIKYKHSIFINKHPKISLFI